MCQLLFLNFFFFLVVFYNTSKIKCNIVILYSNKITILLFTQNIATIIKCISDCFKLSIYVLFYKIKFLAKL